MRMALSIRCAVCRDEFVQVTSDEEDPVCRRCHHALQRRVTAQTATLEAEVVRWKTAAMEARLGQMKEVLKRVRSAKAPAEYLDDLEAILGRQICIDPVAALRRLVTAIHTYRETLMSGLVCLAEQPCRDPSRDHRHGSDAEDQARSALMDAVRDPAIQRAVKESG